MKIGIDLDDVIAKFLEKFLEYYNCRFKTNFKEEDFFCYSMWKVLGDSRENMVEIVKDFNDADLLSEIEPVKKSVKGVNNLKKQYELNIITSRHLKSKRKTIDWLDKYFGNSFKEVYFSSSYFSGEEKGLSKADICKKQNIKYLIEDCAEYAVDCSKSGIKVLLLDKPWNKNFQTENGIIRVNNWNNIINYFRNIQ